MESEAIVVVCKENKQTVTHTVTPLEISTASLIKLYSKMSMYPVIFGRELSGPDDFRNIFMSFSRPSGDPSVKGLFWAVDDLETGVFYLTDIYQHEATVHFAFFDKRVAGREPLFHTMLKHAFDTFGFNRLNASIPKYVKDRVHGFVRGCGITPEGVKRSASFYKGQWFDEVSYGITRAEVEALFNQDHDKEEVKGGSENN